MKKLLIGLLIVLAAAAGAVLWLLPIYTALQEADTLLEIGSYAEAFPRYGEVYINERAFLFKDTAETGLIKCAEAALNISDESFIELAESNTAFWSESSGFSDVLESLKQVRAGRLEAERLAAEEKARQEEEARIAAEQARLAAEKLARQQEKEASFTSALQNHDYLLALSIASGMEEEEDRTAFTEKANTEKTTELPAFRQYWQRRFGAGTWYTAVLGDTLLIQGDARYTEADLYTADSIYTGDFGVLLIKEGVPSFYGDTLGADKEITGMSDIVSGSVGMNHALLLHKDGTVSAVGAKQYEKAAVSEWTDITAVAAGSFHSVGLKSDGTVVYAGSGTAGKDEIALWNDIAAIDAGFLHTVGLKSDGTVVAAGDNSFGQCEVTGWTDIIAIVCGSNHTLGLKSDGTVVAVGDNAAGQCEVAGWSRVLALGAGTWHSAALLEDGRVLSAGANENSQCDTENLRGFTVTEYEMTFESPRGESNEYVYEGDEFSGPWVYYSHEGAVTISLDSQYETVATRADLFCTAGVYPEGILSGGGDSAAGTGKGTTLAKQNHAVFAINGDYYNYGYNPDGVQLRRGQIFKNVISSKKRSLGFAFWPDNTMRVVDPMQTDGEALLALGIRDSWVFGPLLILNGEAQDISYSPLSFNDITLRSAIGSVCACHHIALSCGGATLAEVTQQFLDYGCTIAYNLDGGRSVWMTFMGKRVNRTYYNSKGTRNLSDMIGFLHSDSVK